MIGYIHSTESFGTVDGPGIRYVIFMQGCPMRCAYCHNPDTWEIGAGTVRTAGELLAEYEKNKAFYKNGGITVTGGEPLMQVQFVTELFRLARERGIHTCLDTSGITFDTENGERVREISRLLDYCDLVMLDIKHIDDEKHKKLTLHSNKNVLAFAKYTEEKNIPLWVRHIIIEGITDKDRDLLALGNFIGELKNLKALDVLPYHTMGVAKYREMGISYKLDGLSPMSQEGAQRAKNIILEGIKEVRGKNNR